MVRQESSANARGSTVWAPAGGAASADSTRRQGRRRMGRTGPPPNDGSEPPSERSNLRGSPLGDDRSAGVAAEDPAGDDVVGDAPLHRVRSEPAFDGEADLGED